jgi:hypothetical protein
MRTRKWRGWQGLLVAMLMLSVCPARAAMQGIFTFTGNIGYELSGFGQPSGPMAMGNATLSTLPPGAVPIVGFAFTNDFPPGGGFLDASVTNPASQNFQIAQGAPPTAGDPQPIAQVFGYTFGVPPVAITGNGQYAFNVTPSLVGGNANQISGVGLLVIYMDPLQPLSTITVNAGVLSMGTGGNPNVQSTTFAGPLIGAGAGRLSLLTLADDTFTSGEQIRFNGTPIGGPIDANLGINASVFNFNVTTVGGGNDVATMTSQGDIFGWHVAVLQSPVPEPGCLAWGSVVLAMAAARPRLRMTWRAHQ